MKFQYVSTYVLPSGVDGNWTSYRNPDQPIWELIDIHRYKIVYIRLSSETSAVPFYAGIEQIARITGAIEMTLSSLLKIDLPTDAFFPESNVPTKQINYVTYKDIEKLNYMSRLDCYGTFTPQNQYRDPSENIRNDTPLKELPDILLTNTREPRDVSMIHKTCLAMVNGFLHQTVAPNDTHLGVYIKDGGKTANTSGFSKIGLIDFEQAGGIKKFALSDLTITPPITGNYYNIITISQIPVNLYRQQIMLSLGGYLIFPSPDVLTVSEDDNTVTLDLRKVTIETKIVESSKYLDLSSLGLGSLIPYDEQVDFSLLHDSSVLQAYLRLSQSFLIVIPRNNITFYKTFFRRYNNERFFTTNYDATQLLTSKSDRFLNYWSIPEGEGYKIHLLDFMQVVDNTTSLIYPILTKAYPELKPRDYSIRDYFISLGFFDDP